MLEALMAGERGVTVLADFARARRRAKRGQLEEALRGYCTPHHSFLLTGYLGQIDYLDEAVARVSAMIAQHWEAAQEAIALSGGQRLGGKTRTGSRWRRQVLVEAAHVAAKTKQTYLAAPYRRMAARRGKQRALLALGQTSLLIVDHLLTRKQPYQDFGAADVDTRDQRRMEHRLVRRLERLGYYVSLQPNAL
jgi:transposase